MRDLSRFVPIALLAVGCLMISGIREQKRMPPRTPIAALNVAVPGYVARDTAIDETEQKIAGMSSYQLRLFKETGGVGEFSTYVGYYNYQEQGKAIHSPKNCLPGAGWEALSATEQPIAVNGASYPVNRYLLSNKGHQALVYYWYQGRGRVEANEYKVKLNLLRDAALYGRTEEALVRIVVGIDPVALRAAGPERTYAAADSLATGVARRLIPTVANAIPTSPASS